MRDGNLLGVRSCQGGREDVSDLGGRNFDAWTRAELRVQKGIQVEHLHIKMMDYCSVETDAGIFGGRSHIRLFA
jgi:hypothetical protein